MKISVRDLHIGYYIVLHTHIVPAVTKLVWPLRCITAYTHMLTLNIIFRLYCERKHGTLKMLDNVECCVIDCDFMIIDWPLKSLFSDSLSCDRISKAWSLCWCWRHREHWWLDIGLWPEQNNTLVCFVLLNYHYEYPIPVSAMMLIALFCLLVPGIEWSCRKAMGSCCSCPDKESIPDNHQSKFKVSLPLEQPDQSVQAVCLWCVRTAIGQIWL